MNLKIKFPQMETTDTESEFRPYFPFVLFFFTVLALIVVYAMNFNAAHRVGVPRENFIPLFFIFPWIKAAGITIANALSAFSGKAPEPVSAANYLLTILSLIVVYVIGPTLFFFRWREHRLEKIKNPALPYQPPTVSFILGSVLLLYVVITVIPASVIQPLAFQSLKQNQAVQSSRDELINSLNAIAMNARQYRILPKQLGGGEGTYKGYVMPSEMMSTQGVTFTVIAKDDGADLIATSPKDASSTIIVHLDRNGRLIYWNYSGKFSFNVPPSPWRGLRILFFGS